jgi:glycosyltransferase involved in cell wall biosynthesis
MPEIAGDGAVFIDPYNIQDIREAVIKIIDDKNLRAELIKKGLKNVQRFKPEVIAKQYAELYEKVYRENYH